MRHRFITLFALLAVMAGSVSEVRADRMKWARELAESALGRLGRGVARGGGEALARRIATAAARHGDDLVRGAFHKVGPRALSVADDAGTALAPRALRLVSRHGDEAAAVLTRRSLKLLHLGDDAAEMLVKHKGISTTLLEAFGNSATRALGKLSPRAGRRLAMLKDNLLRVKRAKDLLEVIGKYGEPAMDWIWKNKGTLAATAAMATFLANPEPFINGTRKLTETVAKEVVVPVTSKVIEGGTKVADSVVGATVKPIVTEVSREAARQIPWGPASLLGILVAGGLGALALRRRPAAAAVTH
jgi:hypothetical protein